MSNTKTVMSQAANTLTAPLNVEDVFSTYLYTGNSASQPINNGVDLAGEGGMVWLKARTAAYNNIIVDSERGSSNGTAFNPLFTNLTNAENTAAGYGVTSFDDDGFTLGPSGQQSISNQGGASYADNDYASWTFRKAPKFFDVVTYTGDGTDERQIAHNLGGPVGCLMVKCTSEAADWQVLHKDTTRLILNSTATAYSVANTAARFGDDVTITRPTSTHFTVSTPGNADTNKSGATYVAYLFAHNDGDGEFGPDGDADIIKCGSFTTDGSGNATVDLGWEPQFVIIKRTSSAESWLMHDIMRGWSNGSDDARLFPDLSNAESFSGRGHPTSTGFYSTATASQDYIYIAIRRGTKVPESGTEVFGLNEYTGNNTAGRLITSSGTGVVDAAFINSSGSGSRMASRLTGIPYLTRNDTSAEINSNTRFENFDDMNGFFVGSNSQVNSSSFTYLAAMWKRAPNYFDVVAYTGNSTAGRTVSHNLGVAPEMMWVKPRSATNPWQVYHSATGNTKAINFDTGTGYTSINYWYNTTPSSSEFTLGSSVGFNGSGVTYIAYLFASLPGISKVGSYTGNGTSQTIDCGFTSGARYVLVKRTNTTGDWVEFNSEYGIVAGNEKAWRVNAGGDTGTSLDLIDPDNSGFIINQEASYNLNVNNSTYIFYAVA